MLSLKTAISAIRVVVDTVRAMHNAGIKIFVGTDSNNTNALCHIKHGECLHQEFKLLKTRRPRAC